MMCFHRHLRNTKTSGRCKRDPAQIPLDGQSPNRGSGVLCLIVPDQNEETPWHNQLTN
jgi:hypothetical protein